MNDVMFFVMVFLLAVALVFDGFIGVLMEVREYGPPGLFWAIIAVYAAAIALFAYVAAL